MSEWKMVRLGDIFDLQMGKTPDRNRPEYFNTNTNKWVSIADISKAQKYILETKECISDEAVKNSGIKQIPANTIIMSFKLSIGKTAITTEPMYSNEAIMAFLPNGKYEVDNNFFYHLFSNKNWSEGSNKAVKGVTLNKATLTEVKIPLPPIDEQKHIAAMLDKCADIIAKRKQQLSALDDLIKARFVEMFGEVENNKYPVVRLGDYAKLQGGYAFKSKDFVDNGVPIVQIGNVNQDYLDWDVINAVPEEYLEKYREFALNEGDLVMAMTRPIIKSLDSIKIAKVSALDLPCLLNQRVGRFKVKDKLHPLFLEVLCKMEDFKDYVEKMSGNSLQPNISSKQVEDYMIVLPPLSLQESFSYFVKKIDKTKSAIQKSLEKTQLLFNSLMQEYFE
ncbi:restriction endonuclease subunit S [bacterium]|nr:restriction endonuclease subunit S [bacterium]